MFPQLYIATQVRRKDIQELSDHKTRNCLPLPKTGEIRDVVKADLLSWIKTEVVPAQQNHGLNKVVVLEGSVLVNIAKPENKKTFYSQANNINFPIAKLELGRIHREAIVFDIYQLKLMTQLFAIKDITWVW